MIRTVRFPSLPADLVDEPQPGIVGLHHHVEEHDGHVRAAGEHLLALARGIGGEDLELLAIELVIEQREARALVDGLVVVDDEHGPGARLGRLPLRIVLDDLDDVFAHDRSRPVTRLILIIIVPGPRP
jgi:hypothetical protein